MPMLDVKDTGLLCISMLPMASSCNLFADIVNFYANIKKNFTMLKLLYLIYRLFCLRP